jgi:hypothetical protein
MHARLATLSFTVLAAAVAAQTNASVTTTNGNMVFTQSALSATSNNYVTADLRVAGALGTDSLFSSWWWYRVSGDTQETAFRDDATATRVVADPVITTTWPDVAARGLFRAQLHDELVSTGAASGYLWRTMTVTNISANPLTIDVFAYTDFDMAGSTSNIADGNHRSHYVERVGFAPGGEFMAMNPDATLVTLWQTTTAGSLPFVLTNTAVDNLPGWSGAFGPADYNGAYQWSRTIPPGGRELFKVYLALLDCTPEEGLYGNAGAGTPGLPAIAASERAIRRPFARSFDVTLSNGLPGALCVLVTNFNPAALVIAGLEVWVDPVGAASFFSFVDPAGRRPKTFVVPSGLPLCGVTLHHQFFVIDPAGVGGLAAYTGGLSQVIGSW